MAELIEPKPTAQTIAALDIFMQNADFDMDSIVLRKITNLLNISDDEFQKHLCYVISKFDKPHEIYKLADAYRNNLFESEMSPTGQNNAKSCMLMLLKDQLVSCRNFKKFTIGDWAYDSNPTIKSLHQKIWSDAIKIKPECEKEK